VEGYQHETKVYYEQKSSQKIAHATTSGEKNYQWNTLKSFRSFWLRDIAFSQIYIFHRFETKNPSILHTIAYVFYNV
jgi:hypothetical protein